MQALGASLQAIGLTALFHLPWNLKFLWAPLVDRYESKRTFLIACEVVIVAIVIDVLRRLALPGSMETNGCHRTEEKRALPFRYRQPDATSSPLQTSSTPGPRLRCWTKSRSQTEGQSGVEMADTSVRLRCPN